MDESVDFTRRIIPTSQSDFAVYSTMTTPVLLAHFDGTTGSQVFTDETGRHTLTPMGTDPVISTSQFVFGDASVTFGSSNQAVTVGDSLADFAFGLRDFTIDCWVRITDFTATSIFDIGDDIEAHKLVIYNSGGTGAHFTVFDGTNSPGSLTATTDIWYHIAVTRKDLGMRIFVNGVLDSSVISSTKNYGIPVFGNPPFIGYNDLTLLGFHGFIDEVRVLNGYAAWTSNFGVPSSPYQMP